MGNIAKIGRLLSDSLPIFLKRFYWTTHSLSKIGELELWEGDRIFFELLENEQLFFSLKLVYNTDDVLEYAALDGKEMKDFRRREC